MQHLRIFNDGEPIISWRATAQEVRDMLAAGAIACEADARRAGMSDVEFVSAILAHATSAELEALGATERKGRMNVLVWFALQVPVGGAHVADYLAECDVSVDVVTDVVTVERPPLHA